MTPEPVAYVRNLLLGFPVPWFLCGGWAIDAWLGRATRAHADVDVAVFHRDQRAIFDYFSGWALIGHDPNVPDDTTEPWNGRHLDLPAHVHVRAGNESAFEFEFILVDASDEEWTLQREPRIAVPLDRAIRPAPWGPPVAAPEIVLFYKAEGNPTPRPRDDEDLSVLLPQLAESQRAWLRDALAALNPAHPWLARLNAPG